MNVQLVLFKEDGTRRDIEVKRESVVIGRSGDCDYQIPLAVISRRHCKLSQKGDRLILKDLGSSNGTFLNDKRVLQAEVKPGDRMRLGPVIFTVVIDGEPSEIKPVITVLNAKGESATAAPAAATSNAAPPPSAAAIPETGLAHSMESRGGNTDHIEIVADLDSHDMDGSKAGDSDDVEIEDTGLSPLTELEELAKQRKK
ncbi:MAG TPA: FHA domain-containing protein [Phycisphaerae bacterium]|nr:FHA domain-containing protein [Phycisphaerae bacterium]